MKAGAKGANRERKARRYLEARGYTVVRSAGSRGIVDLVAWNGDAIRLIQVKSGDARATPAERAELAAVVAPACATREVWRWPDRARDPLVAVLEHIPQFVPPDAIN